MNEEKEKLSNELIALNAGIKNIEDNVTIKHKEINEGLLRIDSELLTLKNTIFAEEVDGKKKYSNTDKREQALKEMLTPEHPLTLVKEQIKVDQHLLDMKRNELSFLKRSFRIYEIVSRC